MRSIDRSILQVRSPCRNEASMETGGQMDEWEMDGKECCHNLKYVNNNGR